MTIKKAAKVAKRGWSFAKFNASVIAEAKRLGVSIKGRATRIQACYDENVTVRDTVEVIKHA